MNRGVCWVCVRGGGGGGGRGVLGVRILQRMYHCKEKTLPTLYIILCPFSYADYIQLDQHLPSYGNALDC